MNENKEVEMDMESQVEPNTEVGISLMSLLPILNDLESKVPTTHRNSRFIVQKIREIHQLIALGSDDQVNDARNFDSIQNAFKKLNLTDALPTLPSSSASEFGGSNRVVSKIVGFCLTDTNGMDSQKLAWSKIPLEFLDVNWNSRMNNHLAQFRCDSVLWTILNEILNSSKDTLKHLRIDAFSLFNYTILNLMVLPNLRSLRLFVSHGMGMGVDVGNGNDKRVITQLPIIPAGLKLADTFPQLETIILDLPAIKFEKKSLERFFPGDNFRTSVSNACAITDIHPSVQNLALGCKFTFSGLKAFSKKFPSVTNILVKNVKDVFINDDSVWFLPWDRLETLELRGFSLGERFCGRGLDSFFTGFSDDICYNLRKYYEQEGDIRASMNIQILQKFRSVRDLTNLKSLKIVFNDPKNAEWKMLRTEPVHENNLKPVISNVIGLHAFILMDQLKEIIFAYDFEQPNAQDVATTLEPLAPFVKFVHHPIQLNE